jgi:hypothetical protein
MPCGAFGALGWPVDDGRLAAVLFLSAQIRLKPPPGAVRDMAGLAGSWYEESGPMTALLVAVASFVYRKVSIQLRMCG